MGPEVRVQALFRDRFVGVVRRGHPLALDREVSAQRYAAFGHVVASRRGRAHGPVGEALRRQGLARVVVTIVPSFPAALAVARASDLVALVPASFVAAQRDDPGHLDHVFELPVATDVITVSLMWHPRSDRDPVPPLAAAAGADGMPQLHGARVGCRQRPMRVGRRWQMRRGCAVGHPRVSFYVSATYRRCTASFYLRW